MVLPPQRSGTPDAKPTNGASPAPNGDRFAVTSGRLNRAQKVVIYGPGGVGKSSLARLAPGAAFIDIEDSTGRLDVQRVGGVSTWADLRACLQSDALDKFQTVVIDSLTKAEELAVVHTLQNTKTEKGATVTSIEGYGFGKGYQHVYDTFLHLLVDLDRHVRAGRNVVLVSHVCTAKVPNPAGEDFIRYEPRLQQTKDGRASIRSRVFEWADHVLYVGYDVATDEGKGKGGGSRTIFTSEDPTHLAKMRELNGVRVNDRAFVNCNDGAIWPLILGGAS